MKTHTRPTNAVHSDDHTLAIFSMASPLDSTRDSSILAGNHDVGDISTLSAHLTATTFRVGRPPWHFDAHSNRPVPSSTQ